MHLWPYSAFVALANLRYINALNNNNNNNNPNVLAAVSKGMQAAILCTNKIRQFLTAGAG